MELKCTFGVIHYGVGFQFLVYDTTIELDVRGRKSSDIANAEKFENLLEVGK